MEVYGENIQELSRSVEIEAESEKKISRKL